MKILHTSDWHLGQVLYSEKRENEHREFLQWLLGLIGKEKIDLLLVAGDIFDTGSPSNYSLEMYFSFLADCCAAGCAQVIVIGGNHDSPSTLRAPRHILKAIRVTVVGEVDKDNLSRDLIVAKGNDGKPGAIVCAVPYLRDRDVYSPQPGEEIETRAAGIIKGVATWYRSMADLAVAERGKLGLPGLPILAMGHLFAKGMLKSGKERDLYVGNLSAFPVEQFPTEFAYVALGHLHMPQIAGKQGNVRYSGSPIPLSFDEIEYAKKVFIIDTDSTFEVRDVTVPVFKQLVRIAGDLTAIRNGFNQIQVSTKETWVEVIYTGATHIPNLLDQVGELAKKRGVKLIACPIGLRDGDGEGAVPSIDIAQLTPELAFEYRLKAERLTPDDEAMVGKAFREILKSVAEGEQE